MKERVKRSERRNKKNLPEKGLRPCKELRAAPVVLFTPHFVSFPNKNTGCRRKVFSFWRRVRRDSKGSKKEREREGAGCAVVQWAAGVGLFLPAELKHSWTQANNCRKYEQASHVCDTSTNPIWNKTKIVSFSRVRNNTNEVNNSID